VVKRWLQKGYIYLVFLFLYLPIFILMLFSFNASRSRGSWDGFTLQWYIELFRDRTIMSSLYYTVVVAVLSSVISTIIGTAAAIGIHRLQGLRKNILLNLTYIPVLNPDIVTGVSLMLLFIFLKVPLGFVTMLLAHITFSTPYVILCVLPKLRQMDNSIYEAALDLGATPWYSFKKVVLPEIASGIMTGFLLAFTLSIDDFVISFFTTGSGVANLSITVYSMARRGINPKINAVSTLMFVSVLILLVIVNLRIERDRKRRELAEHEKNRSSYPVAG
jgi:spermidine/putrescine transport system permease protein